MTDSNPNVITTWNTSAARPVYHSDVCWAVWEMADKRYIPESAARRHGYSECAACRQRARERSQASVGRSVTADASEVAE